MIKQVHTYRREHDTYHPQSEMGQMYADITMPHPASHDFPIEDMERYITDGSFVYWLSGTVAVVGYRNRPLTIGTLNVVDGEVRWHPVTTSEILSSLWVCHREVMSDLKAEVTAHAQELGAFNKAP